MSEVPSPTAENKNESEDLESLKLSLLKKVGEHFQLPPELIEATQGVPVSVAPREHIIDHIIRLINPLRMARKSILEQKRFLKKTLNLDIPMPDEIALSQQYIDQIKQELQNFGGIFIHEKENLDDWKNKLSQVFLGKAHIKRRWGIFLEENTNLNHQYALQHELLHALSCDERGKTGFLSSGADEAIRMLNEAITELLNMSVQLNTKDLTQILKQIYNQDIQTGYIRIVKQFIIFLNYLKHETDEEISIDRLATLYFDTTMIAEKKSIYLEMLFRTIASKVTEPNQEKVQKVMGHFGMGELAAKKRMLQREQDLGK